jgi:hypothetical protein
MKEARTWVLTCGADGGVAVESVAIPDNEGKEASKPQVECERVVDPNLHAFQRRRKGCPSLEEGIDDGDVIDHAAVTQIFGVKLRTAEGAGGGDDGAVPV